MSKTLGYKLLSVGESKSNDILSIKRLGEYLYETTYDNLPEYKESNLYTLIKGCTSFVRNGKTYRSFDLTYDNTAEFIIHTKEFDGIALINGMDDGELNDTALSQLPYHLADGCNRDNIVVTEHVLFNDQGFAGTGTKENDLTKFPTVVLQNLHSMSDILMNVEISNFLANAKLPEALDSLGYSLHYLITDGTTTYTVTPKDDGSGYEFKDISSNPKLTNFKHVNGKIVNREDMDLQNRPTGIERWNLIEEGASLEDLRFTKCYESPSRLSEFIGEDGTTKASTDAELEVIYNKAHAEYIIRERNGKTWQSMHAIVYGENGIESLYVQENYNKDYFPYNKNDIIDLIEEKLTHETWTFTLEDDSTVDKEVVLWKTT